MKKLILACGLACATGLAFAADPAATTTPMPPQHMMMKHHGEHMNGADHADMLKQKLQLSDEQTAKVKKIFEAKQTESKALHEKYKPQLDAFHADEKKLRDKTHADIESVLTPAQKEQFKKMHMGGMCDGHGKGDMKHGGGMGGGMGGDMHKGMMQPQSAPPAAAKPAASKT